MELVSKAWFEKHMKSFLVLVSFSVCILDQLSKWFVSSVLQPGDSVPVIPGFFNIVLTHNKGVAFGMFSGIENDVQRYGVLALTTLLALTAVWYFAKQEQCKNRLSYLAIAMILGGALGNIIDRVRLGEVVDFLDVFYKEYHWPAFNLADSAISIAVVLLLLVPSTPKVAKPAPTA